jgi:alkylation response protein AidB-like acyl-CoA dehydrogenase
MDNSMTLPQGGDIQAQADHWTDIARKIAPLVASESDRIEHERKVPKNVMKALHEANLFRLLMPKSIGGYEADPLSYMQVVEEISAADASAGWCLGQGLGCSLASAFLDKSIASKIFDAPNGILAWGPPNGAKAIKVKNGYRVSGRWRFGSGSPNATWLGGHSAVCEADGSPAKDGKGRPIMRTMLFPKEECQIHKVWDVIGLRGTGSDDYEVKDLFVPEEHTTWRDSLPDRRENGPLYDIPLLTMYGMGFSGVTQGIARTVLKDFVELARNKKVSGMEGPLCQNSVIQSETAQATAKLLSGRAFVTKMIKEFYETAVLGEEFSLDLRAKLRISITWSMQQAKEVVDFCYHAAGTNAIFEKNPFERRFRDIHTVTQQGQAHMTNFEFSGQALFGRTPGHRL